MLASEYDVFEDITDTMQKALNDKKIRMECEARERYERDRTSLFNSGRREGIAEGIAKGHADGQSTERLTTIQKLHAKGKSVDEIMELLDFSREEVMTAINTSD